MKKVLVIAMMALVMASCSKSPEQIAQQLIKDSFTEDPQTAQFYEPVAFGTLDSVFTTLQDCEEYMQAYNAYHNFLDNYEFDKAQIESKKALEIQESFISEFKGWKMNHKFNVNNGIVLPFEVDIYFNKELTEIIGRGEIK
jgi:hypothetical protein